MSKFTKEMVTDYADKLLIGLTEEETAEKILKLLILSFFLEQ